LHVRIIGIYAVLGTIVMPVTAYQGKHVLIDRKDTQQFACTGRILHRVVSSHTDKCNESVQLYSLYTKELH